MRDFTHAAHTAFLALHSLARTFRDESQTVKTPGKLLLGAATLYPLAYMFAFMGVWFYLVASMMRGGFAASPPTHGSGPPTWFLGLAAMHLMTMVWMLGLLIFYIRDVFRNPHVQEQKRALWAVVLFMGNGIAMPIYWYLFIWKGDRERA